MIHGRPAVDFSRNRRLALAMALFLVRRISVKAIVGLSATLAVVLAIAQSPRDVKAADDGRIEVVVTDASGAIVPKARVRVANQIGEQVAEGVSDDYGRFQYSGLAADTYAVTVLAPGLVANTQHVNVPKHNLISIGAELQIAHGGHTLVYGWAPTTWCTHRAGEHSIRISLDRLTCTGGCGQFCRVFRISTPATRNRLARACDLCPKRFSMELSDILLGGVV
jgi:hypothetical protein